MVDLLKPEARPAHLGEKRRMGMNGDLETAEIRNLQWLLAAPKFKQEVSSQPFCRGPLLQPIDWLKELGYDAPPTTPEEFKEMACKAVEQPFSKSIADGSIGYELSTVASRFASWAFAFGGDVFDYETGLFS